MSPLEVVTGSPYNFFYSLAVVAAALSMFLAGKRQGWGETRWALVVAAWATAGMVGAMLPHLLFGDAVAFRTSLGAVIFSTLVIAVVARALRRDTAAVLDTTAVAIPIGAAVVRIGCFFAECCQGIATSLPIGVALHADDAPRHPVQLYESVLELVLAVLMARRSGSFAELVPRTARDEGLRTTSGRRFATSIAGMSAIRFATEFVRDNDKFGGLSLAQWVVLPIGVLCLILLLSRPRARKPTRVLTAGARRATIGVVGMLAIGAVAAGLTALESTMLLVGAALLLVAAIRKLGRVAPTGLAMLVLQMPAISADSTYPRTYRYFGAGANMGFWDAVHHSSDCDNGVTEDWTRHHRATGASLEFGAREQASQTRGMGIRGRAYYGTDHSGAAIVTIGSPGRPGAFTRNNAGLQAVVDADWKWFGFSLGGSLGQFYPATMDDDFGPGEDFSATTGFPSFGVRFGRLQGLSFEGRIGDESPMWVPGPAASLSLAVGDRAGNRLRIGAADEGLLIAAEKFMANGFAVLPTFVLGDGGKSFHGGIAFRKWIRVERRSPDER